MKDNFLRKNDNAILPPLPTNISSLTGKSIVPFRLDKVAKAELDRCAEFLRKVTEFDQSGASLRRRSEWNKNWLESLSPTTLQVITVCSCRLTTALIACS